eukprot:IDg2709t1
MNSSTISNCSLITASPPTPNQTGSKSSLQSPSKSTTFVGRQKPPSHKKNSIKKNNARKKQAPYAPRSAIPRQIIDSLRAPFRIPDIRNSSSTRHFLTTSPPTLT